MEPHPGQNRKTRPGWVGMRWSFRESFTRVPPEASLKGNRPGPVRPRAAPVTRLEKGYCLASPAFCQYSSFCTIFRKPTMES